MLSSITPVVLTFNEADNIGRTLSHLAWARDIVVVDSGSTDETLTIVHRFPQVRLFTRLFDTHAAQWRFATNETQIKTPWIFRLDADYIVTEDLIAELANLDPDPPVSAYRIAFDYAVYSHPLRTSLYPRNTLLLRKGRFHVIDRGHTEVWMINGAVKALGGRVVHDDWKPVEAWMMAQGRYMRREAHRVLSQPKGIRDWLRRHPPLMPLAAFVYCLFAKGLIRDGRVGLFYALQRLVAESVLSLMILERRLKHERPSPTRERGAKEQSVPAD